jgi:hypothetical protein
MVYDLGHGRELAAGQNLHLGPTWALPATRPQNTRRPWLVSDEEENFSTHCTGKASARCRRGVGQFFQQLQQAGAVVAGPAVSAVDHVVALERRDGHGGRDWMPASCATSQRAADVGKGQGRVGHGVELVDGKHQRIHAQQMGQQAVAAGLGQQLQIGILPVQLGGIDQHHGGIGARCGRHHVAVYCSWPGASPMMNLRSRWRSSGRPHRW